MNRIAKTVRQATMPSLVIHRSRWLWTAVAVAAGVLTGCAVELQNIQPAKELAQSAKPPGSVYVGWRLFQEKCAACHGPAALGTNKAPDLLPRVREMGPHQFASLVLQRYDWNHSTAKSGADAASREAMVQDILRGKDPVIVMPAWEGNPSVNAHIVDLYAYLTARSLGTQGFGRPAN